MCFPTPSLICSGPSPRRWSMMVLYFATFSFGWFFRRKSSRSYSIRVHVEDVLLSEGTGVVEWDESLGRGELKLVGDVLAHCESAPPRIVLLHRVRIARVAVREEEWVEEGGDGRVDVLDHLDFLVPPAGKHDVGGRDGTVGSFREDGRYLIHPGDAVLPSVQCLNNPIDSTLSHCTYPFQCTHLLVHAEEQLQRSQADSFGWGSRGQDGSFIIHHSSFIIHHSSFIIHHSSFNSSFIIHHSSFIIHHHHVAFIGVSILVHRMARWPSGFDL
jgi:hypothetical protein